MLVNPFVVDANVLVSAAVFSSFVPTNAIKQAITKGTVVVSEEVLSEYTDILCTHKFDKYITPGKRLLFLEKFISISTFIVPEERIAVCRDPKDNKFLELAVAAKASAIITGDKDLLVLHPFKSISIVSPSDFLERF